MSACSLVVLMFFYLLEQVGVVTPLTLVEKVHTIRTTVSL